MLLNNLFYNFFIFRDKNGNQSVFQPIAVIEHLGKISKSGSSYGHYICDVKQHLTNQWYRTNDSTDPVQLGSADVSNCGYIILYSRK